MTIQDIRYCIQTINYFGYSDGAWITYTYGSQKKSIVIDSEKLYADLLLLSSVDNREEFEGYKLSQWDALNIVIRHEMANEMEKEAGMIDINQIIGKLK